jgi:Leu/Phe-tRNA-protein transferase
MTETALGVYNLPYETFFDSAAMAHIYADMQRNYYWSDDFSAAYYIAQAQRGFIAVTDRYEDKELLLPEIQFAYAVLHFENLHISRHVQRILKRRDPGLHIRDGVDSDIIKAIRRHHNNCWLTPRYEETLRAAHEAEENFAVFSSWITDEKGFPVAGEVGYVIGNTYTSLSGFSSREKRYRNYGKTQMVLLARFLQEHDFAFWNLGHPYMRYKFDLGAELYERHDFLKLWYENV